MLARQSEYVGKDIIIAGLVRPSRAILLKPVLTADTANDRMVAYNNMLRVYEAANPYEGLRDFVYEIEPLEGTSAPDAGRQAKAVLNKLQDLSVF